MGPFLIFLSFPLDIAVQNQRHYVSMVMCSVVVHPDLTLNPNGKREHTFKTWQPDINTF